MARGEVALWLLLFDDDGDAARRMARGAAARAAAASCSTAATIRARFDLPEFTGQLFLHVVGAAGHDVVKYALDTFGASAAETTPLLHP